MKKKKKKRKILLHPLLCCGFKSKEVFQKRAASLNLIQDNNKKNVKFDYAVICFNNIILIRTLQQLKKQIENDALDFRGTPPIAM